MADTLTATLSIALAQLNPTVGDVEGNLARLRKARAEAARIGAQLVVASELYICGYPPEDLVLKSSFLEYVHQAALLLARETADNGPAILLGAPVQQDGKVFNAALLLDKGEIAATVLKRDLPNYGPFDEKRIFVPGPLPEPVLFHGVSLGIMVCEDMWSSDAARHLKERGAEILIVPNGSPYETAKRQQRMALALARCIETDLPLIYVNQLGGQDELVFDGESFACDAEGNRIVTLPAWEEMTAVITYADGKLKADPSLLWPELDLEASAYHALVVGLRDYVTKNKFPGVILGMSGGIDSALAAAIAVDALGADKVRGVMLPSPYTSKESTEDAIETMRLLGCRLDDISIDSAMKVFDAALRPVLGDRLKDITSENIQSRSRGLVLMALSNATGHMVLSTGNKSEMAVGYATLYGDMCGGFAVLKDVYKTLVYKLASWRNAQKPSGGLGPAGIVIPTRVLTKAPTAELRPDQKDQDSLPPYETLDAILVHMIEGDRGVADIIAHGFAPETVTKVWQLLHAAEYKRRQAPPGVKITRRNLGRDRRYPITNQYKEKTK